MFTDSVGPAMESRAHKALWCSFYGGGIIGTLLIYGLLQERIMVMPYGDPPQMFTDSVFLVFLNRLVGVVFWLGIMIIRQESLRNSAPLWKCLAISVSNVYASTCQYEALKYVTFPVQMLGKSFKMMPVMVWGILMAGDWRKHTLSEWAVAAVVTGGVTEFLMTGPIEAKSHVAGSSFYGLALLAAFLALDGFTSTYQEKVFKTYDATKANQAFYVNICSVVISSTTLLASGKLGHAAQFMVTHPRFAWDALLLSLAAVASNWFILSMIKEFGALVFAATMNVRQVVSIIVSYITYGKAITRAQILGLMMVFTALFYKSVQGFITEKHAVEQLPFPTVGVVRYDGQTQQTSEPQPVEKKAGVAEPSTQPRTDLNGDSRA